MASALERAARAAALANEDEGCFDPVSAYEPIARAVLMAVRGVEGHGIEMNWWSERIVDAILNEKDTTGD